jgi:PAS domain S-box-containing protein
MSNRPYTSDVLRLARRWRAWPVDGWRGVRSRSAGMHIAILCAACIIPMLAISLLVSWRLAEAERDVTRVQLLNTTRALSGAIDLKLQKAQAALSALATSPSLAPEVSPAFYRQCADVAAEHNAWILAVDPAGNELVNTQAGPGRPDRRLSRPAILERTLKSGVFQVSDVFEIANNGPQISTYLPIFRQDGPPLVLIMSFKVEEIARILMEQDVPQTWTITVTDRENRIVARNRAMERFAGASVSPNLIARLKSASSMSFFAETQDGTPVLAAFNKSTFSGWAVTIGIPVAEVNGPLLRSLGEMGTAGLIMLLAGMVMAGLIGGHITRSLAGLARAALAVAEDQPWTPVRSSIREVNDVAAAQKAGQNLLLQRSRERDAAEALLRDAVDSISEGFVIFDPEDRLVMYNERYQQLYPQSASYLAPGTRFEDLLREGIARREYPDAIGREDKWLAERLRQHREAAGAVEQRHGDGRWIMITERRMRNGGIAGLRVDITEWKRAQAEAEAARLRMTDWAAAANDWFWETDGALRFTYVSDGFQATTGIDPAAIIGKPIDVLRSAHSDPKHWEQRMAAFAAYRPFRDSLNAALVDGRIVHISVSGKPVFGSDGTFRGYRGTGRDVTAQIEADRALAEQSEIFSTLIRNIPIGISLVDRDMKITALNRQALVMYDVAPDAIKVGDPFADFLRLNIKRGYYGPVDDVEAEIGRRLDVLARPEPAHFERTRPDGGIIEIRRVPLPGGGFVATYIDVTEPRRRETDLLEARARLEHQAAELDAARIAAEHAREAAADANTAKSLFLANMSHELRTPLNAILGFSEVMSSAMIGPLDTRYRSYAQDIHESGQYLLRLISDVLDLSKIEVGQMTLHEESVDLADVAMECIRLLADKADAGRIAVDVALPDDMPPVTADRLRLKQVLLNLLSNAVKFTPAGGRIEVAGALQPDRSVVLRITDSGIGMQPQDIAVALEPFRQVDNTLTRRYEGTGLGLPIAKTLVEMHGGRLSLRSRAGEGTVVEIWLPPGRVSSLRPAATP